MTVDVGFMAGEHVLFTQTDPLQATVGQAYPSTYIYANNNPNRFVDPAGLRSNELVWQMPADYSVKTDSLSDEDPRNFDFCKKPYPSRFRMCRGYARASAVAILAVRDVQKANVKNAVRHCVWSCLLTAQLGWKGAYTFLAKHEGKSYSDTEPEVQAWRDRGLTYTTFESAWMIESRLGPRTEVVFVSSIASGELTVIELTKADWLRSAQLIEPMPILGLAWSTRRSLPWLNVSNSRRSRR
jgi:hypothetical protein